MIRSLNAILKEHLNHFRSSKKEWYWRIRVFTYFFFFTSHLFLKGGWQPRLLYPLLSFTESSHFVIVAWDLSFCRKIARVKKKSIIEIITAVGYAFIWNAWWWLVLCPTSLELISSYSIFLVQIINFGDKVILENPVERYITVNWRFSLLDKLWSCNF